jgi:hypothetical protein
MILNPLPASVETRGSAPAALEPGEAKRRAHGASHPRSGLSFAVIADQVESDGSADGAVARKETGPELGKSFSLWQNGDFSFGDFLDIINPLHHVPIVATIYRNLSGDALGLAPRVIGGALWGRLGGLAAGVINAALEWFTGKDIGDHVYAFFFGDPKATSADTALAGRAGSPDRAQKSEAASDSKIPRVYPASLPRSPRDGGLRSEIPSDRRDAVATPAADLQGDPVWPARLRAFHYHRSAEPTAEDRNRFSLMA